MNIKKIAIFLVIVLLFFVFTINSSFATLSEKTTYTKGKDIYKFDKKIVTIDRILKFNNKNLNESVDIKVKNNYKSSYKIKSVSVKYNVHDYDKKKFVSPIYKKYDGKNKTKIAINTPANSSINKIVVNYLTKSKINKETTKLQSINKLKSYTVFTADNAIVKLWELGSSRWTSNGIFLSLNYQKFKVKTKSKIYKIESLKALYYRMNGKLDHVETFGGHGKTGFTITNKGIYKNLGIAAFKLTYY